jgi:hypothetical protein
VCARVGVDEPPDLLLDALRIRQKRSFRKYSLPVVRVGRNILVHGPTFYDAADRPISLLTSASLTLFQGNFA